MNSFKIHLLGEKSNRLAKRAGLGFSLFDEKQFNSYFSLFTSVLLNFGFMYLFWIDKKAVMNSKKENTKVFDLV